MWSNRIFGGHHTDFGDEYAMWCKRREEGTFPLPRTDGEEAGVELRASDCTRPPGTGLPFGGVGVSSFGNRVPRMRCPQPCHCGTVCGKGRASLWVAAKQVLARGTPVA